MRIIGLTGGIGSGKSTVANMFRELGIPVYNSDDEAKNLMVGEPTLKMAITELMGGGAYTEHGELNREFIAEKVFVDKEILQKLNNLVHPAVKKDFKDWAKEQEAPYVIQETALIFENGAQNQYDATILVTAPIDLRIERVIKRDGTTQKHVLDRIKHQLMDSEKKELATYCLENVDLENTAKEVLHLHYELCADT